MQFNARTLRLYYVQYLSFSDIFKKLAVLEVQKYSSIILSIMLNFHVGLFFNRNIIYTQHIFKSRNESSTSTYRYQDLCFSLFYC